MPARGFFTTRTRAGTLPGATGRPKNRWTTQIQIERNTNNHGLVVAGHASAAAVRKVIITSTTATPIGILNWAVRGGKYSIERARRHGLLPNLTAGGGENPSRSVRAT
jgi:hypothetical protein